MRALHARVRGLKALGTASARMLGSTGVAALPHVRLLMVRARAVLGQASIVVGPKLGAARRLAAAQLGRKRRRTTAGGSGAAVRERESNDSGSLVRTIGIGAFVTLIAGLGVYAMLPSSEPELELHRAIAAPQGEAGLSGAEAALAVDDQGAGAAQTAAEPELPMPSAATVPAGSAYAVDVREQARTKPAAAAALAAPKAAAPAPQAVATKPAPRSMRFGVERAFARPNLRLRMSKPIASISGSAIRRLHRRRDGYLRSTCPPIRPRTAAGRARWCSTGRPSDLNPLRRRQGPTTKSARRPDSVRSHRRG